MSIKRAINVLLEAESELRRLIAEAAQQGDYRPVEAVALWAIALNEMAASGREITTAPPPSLDSKRPAPTTPKKCTKRSSKKATRPKAKTRSYPKFARSGDTLVKVAGSKSQKSEYKHKSPRSVLSHLVDSLGELLGERSVVAMETVLPLKGEDGQDIPDYQVYLCLAWLRSVGAVEQKGREGYTRNGLKGSLREVVNEEWNSLPDGV